MQIKIEEIDNNYFLNSADVSISMSLKDIENLISHLEYFINNSSVKSLKIEVGGE